jgi:glycosyltransferase involved in cell wall biosynthesis
VTESRENLHILHVVPGLAPGGMELSLARVITELSVNGIRHSIACLKGDAEIADRLAQQTEIYCFHSSPNELRLPFRLATLIRRVRPSVIHARNWGAWPDVALARYATWPPVPLIFSFHGVGEAGYMPLRRRLASRILVKLTTCLFTVSESTKQMLVARWGWPEQNVLVIPNGVDTHRFQPAERGTRHPGVVVGNVGSLRPVKNQALLVRACARLAAEGSDLELRIAGEGPERAKLLRIAESMNFTERLTLCGQVSDIPDFLRELDIFVLSSDSEAHPNALLEALACGVPCVGTRVGSVAEVLDEGRYGQIVEPGNIEDMAQAIRSLIHNTDLHSELRSAGRQRVCDKYSMERMAATYTELYERISLKRTSCTVREKVT